jgi:YebC/PmpR family DNA-binding regulatory protein
MSGHSKWSTIKREKGAKDVKRNRVFTKLIKEITVSAKLGGGDPAGNARLRRALDFARVSNLPAENIKRAIKKGTGELEGVNYEELVYEGVGVAGCLFVLEVMTDNRNRTAAELRRLFEKGGGQLGVTGSSLWAFSQKGVIRLPIADATEDQLFDIAVSAGAEDVTAEEEQWSITTPREGLDTVRDALEKAGLRPTESRLAYIPSTPKEVSGAHATALVALHEALDEHDDVQKVFTDFELSEEAAAALAQS